MLGTLPLSSGCTGQCTGAACASLFDASLLSLHQGSSRMLRGEANDPIVGEVYAAGTALHGVDWRPLLASDALMLGVPELSQVLSLGGPDLASSTQLDAITSGSISGESTSDRFGAATARVPDMDGNGLAELWVGAPSRQGGANALEAGAAYLFMDLGDGWSGDRTTADARLILLGSQAYDQLGAVVAGCADLDGDGAGDLLVSSGWGDAEGGALPLAGRVHAILSSDLDPDGARQELLVDELPITWEGMRSGEQLGRSLLCSHDLTGDGGADVVLGAPFAGDPGEGRDGTGAIYIMDPPADWSGGPVINDTRLTYPRVSTTPDTPEAHLGMSLAAGDLDGDGRPELAAGATGAIDVDGDGYGDGYGAILIFGGAALSLGVPVVDTTITGSEPGGHLGAALAAADLDGDGVDDLLAGAPRADSFGNGRAFASGILYLFKGGEVTSGPSTFPASQATATYASPQQFLQAGETIATGDYDGVEGADVLLTMRVDPSDLPIGN